MNLALMLLVGLYLGNKLPLWIGRLVTYFQNRAIIRSITPSAAKKEKLCKGPHSWIIAHTYTDNGPGTAQICRMCGFISGTDKMASAEAIDRIEDNNKIRELENKLYKDFLQDEDNKIKSYFQQEINNGLDLDKVLHVHAAGMTFGQRYGIYKASKAEDIEKELNKSNA